MLTELFNAWKETKSEWKIQIVSDVHFRLVKSKGNRHHCEWKENKIYIDNVYICNAEETSTVVEILRKNLSS